VTHVENFLNYFREEAAAFYHEIERSRKSDPEAFNEIAEYLLSIAEMQIGDNCNEVLVEGYCTFVMEVNKSQREYEINRQYRYKTYAEVYKKTYDNPEFMKLYHWGVFVTTFAWEHHLRIYRMFRDQFLPLATNQEQSHLLDLGSGSGVWHLLALKLRGNLKSTAVDISRTSIDISRETAQRIGFGGVTDYICMDALEFSPAVPYDAGISCFLLEHLETPQKALEVLCNAIKDRSYAFLTCALTAAEIDHIYEFKYEHEVAKIIYDAGFRIIRSLSSSPSSFPPDKVFLPRSFALILQKRSNAIW
jgi:2-polyprenyl-3-methyl-5-hydroxy-6-metoxy-1,4-benzoquinol methylase